MLKKVVSLVVILVLFATISCKENASPKITEEDVKASQTEAPITTPEIQQSAEVMATVPQSTIPANGKVPKIEFNKVEHDFGTIKSGDKVHTEFMVKNIGDADLVIIDAVGSCGCTVPDKPKEPIKPGSSAPIKVTFDSTGKSGQQNKTVTLTTNTANGKETVTVKANILAKE